MRTDRLLIADDHAIVRAGLKIDKLHAVLGGFHLGAAPADYIDHTVAELKAFAPDVVVPMHCSGRPFIAKVAEAMPQQLVAYNTGSRFTFGV